jgi:hypothetical protein
VLQPGFLESLQSIDLGRDTTFTAPLSGTLYLRSNDLWGDLSDNTGEYRAKIELVKARDPVLLP